MAKEGLDKSQGRNLKGLIIVLTIILLLTIGIIGWEVIEGTGAIKENTVFEPSENSATISLSVLPPERPPSEGLT